MRFRFVVPMLALFLGACDLLGPERYEQYHLITINSQNLPVASVVEGLSSYESVKYAGGKLTLWDEDFFLDLEQPLVLTANDGSGTATFDFGSRERGTYEIDGSRLFLIMPGSSGPTYSGIREHGKVTLIKEIITDLNDEPDTLVFVRKR